ncbi:MAG: corrinoid protein-associated methyltransferase CpaM [bacterium]
MSTYILMRILESAPQRYDKGISFLTLGKITRVYDHLASHIMKGQKVLDIGCGTGAMTLRAASRGAWVKGIDTNSQMLELAQERVEASKLNQNIELCETGVAELCDESSDSYDAILSTLCFSELSDDELVYTLQEVYRILKPGGILLVADEITSSNILMKLLNWLLRFPLVVITYLLTQTTTHAVKNLPEKIRNSGLLIKSANLNKLENFVELVAIKPASYLQ